MLPPVLKTPPVLLPVTLAKAKLHMRIDHDEEDTLVEAMLGAAVSHLDGWSGILGRCMINQVWTQRFASFGSGLRLPFPDISAVALTYLDEAGASQTVVAADYEIYSDHLSSVLRFKNGFLAPALSSDSFAPVTVEMTAGYGAVPADVPQALRHAVMLLAGHFYENREATAIGVSVAELPMGVHALIAPFRRGVI